MSYKIFVFPFSVVLFVHLDFFGVSWQVFEISAVEMFVFSPIYWN